MNQLAETLRDILVRIPGLEVAILFGSQTSGTATADSDVDLAILLDRPLSPALKQNIIEDVAAHARRPVDVVDLYGGSAFLEVDET